MYHFHANLIASLKRERFACTWEDAAQRLEALPRMIFELDGSFIITGERSGASPPPCDHATRWQVDGQLFDFSGRLHRVELHGHCPPAALDDLLRCFGWPEQSLAFELVREGITVSESEFRARAAR